MTNNKTHKVAASIALVLFLFVGTNAFAQQQIKGKVIDASTGEALPGVNILVLGTTKGTATDTKGNYQLTVPAINDTLRFSYIGYKSQNVPINGRTTINVKLTSLTVEGQQVVVVGYGTQKKEDVTGAVASVSSSDFINSSPQDAAALIKGKIAGLIINQPSGSPTATSEIKMRGTSTLYASSSPLVLIDGIPGNLNTVSPQNIASISVLKGGSAAAIYGSRGSNGVILITTKQHKGNQPPTISYQTYVNVQQIKKKPNFMNAAQIRAANKNYNAGFIDYGHNTDWANQILRQSLPVGTENNLVLSGGNTNTNYRATLNYRRTNGIFRRSYNQRVQGRIHVSHSMFNDRLVTKVNLSSKVQDYPTDFNNYIWHQAIIRNPTDRVYNDQGGYQIRPQFNYDNPVSLLNEDNGKVDTRDLRLNGTMRWDPFKTLSLKVLGSLSKSETLSGYSETFQHISTLKNNVNGYASRGLDSNTDKLMEFTANYENSFGENNVKLLGGYSYQQQVYQGFSANNSDFPSDLFSYNNLSTGNYLTQGKANMSSYKNSYKLIGFFSRLNYNYANKYLLMVSLRYEGNSKFGANHKWGYFPAVSAGWRIDQENFMKKFTFIDNLKVRAGYGVTGIAPSDSYLSLASYGFGAKFYDNGQWVQGIVPTRNANPNLKWERKVEYDLGLDFALFDNHVSGSFDLYDRKTKDLLFNYSVPSPPYLYNTILANVGEMSNKGLEASLNFTVFQTHKFLWKTGFNYSTNRNKLVSLSNDQFKTQNNYIDTGYIGESVQLNTHRIYVGGPVGNFYGYKSVGIASDGSWLIQGANGKTLKYPQKTSLTDRQVIGNGIPKDHISWNNTVKYKNWDLNVDVHGAFGFQILNYDKLFYTNPNYTQYNLMPSAFDKVYGKRQLDSEWAYMSYYLENGNYVKVDNITLGYTFNVNKVDYISHARLYLSLDNAFTFTGYSGMDPEVSISGLAPGDDHRGKYPTTRTFTLGLNLNF